MPRPLEELLLEEEIRRLQLELAKLEGVFPDLPRRIEDCEYLKHIPVNSGPEYLTVHSEFWDRRLWVDGVEVRSLDNARQYAKDHGYKGISIKFGEPCKIL